MRGPGPTGGIAHASNIVTPPAFWLRRDGVGRVVRAHRYALAVALGGRELPASEMALHECDNPLCVRVLTGTQDEHDGGVDGGDVRL